MGPPVEVGSARFLGKSLRAPRRGSCKNRMMQNSHHAVSSFPLSYVQENEVVTELVTHEMGFARKVADRVVFMDKGEIVEDALKDDFFGKPQSDRAQQFLSKILQH
jgi:ABC-type glutathione transport system ATPase component